MIINKMEERFEKMTVSFGPEHDFIGIKLKFLEDRRLHVDIMDYLRTAVKDFDKSGLKVANDPAKYDLIYVDLWSRRKEA